MCSLFVLDRDSSRQGLSRTGAKAESRKDYIMETAILVALGLVVGLAIAGLAVFVAR
jgi:hypothetical protein